MLSCIYGVILCLSPSAMLIPGPIGHAPQPGAPAWAYAAYYGVPAFQQGPLTFPTRMPAVITSRGT